jgi:hypothetical protein
MHVHIEPQTCGDIRLQVLLTSKLDTPDGSISELNNIHEDAKMRYRELSLDKLPTTPFTRVQISYIQLKCLVIDPRVIANGVAAEVEQAQAVGHRSVADSS